ncbi:MAG TPA: hypothetical protein VOA41_11315, partial [Candidatus Dormibacteraeota bacterium]|nr:hypothetical protein [Candidatus Dormibacteraeota bacterium]
MSNKLLNSYIRQVETRLRVARYLRGSAIFACAALLTTIIAVPLMNASAFSISSVLSARGALVFVLAVALGLGLIVPLLRLTRRRAAAKAESTFPQFQQRLVTFVELGDNAREPFIELLAADTLAVARDAEPARLAPSATLLASLGAGIAATGILIWMIAAGPGYLGYGARLLWAGPHKNAAPLYQLRVTPGDATVRRNGNQLVTAQLIGMQPDVVRLFARYQSASKWDEVPMQPERGGSGYVFLFAGLPEGVEYYVQAGALHSRHFNLRVVDLPGVKSIRVTYRFPAWTGLPSIVEGHGGDLRAVEGSEAELEVKTDRPLSDGLLVLDTNQQIRLSGGAGSVYKGTIAMKNDGLYHVAVLDRGEAVRLSEDFFIETNKPNPPEVHIRRPGRDYRSSPIEEVTVDVGATDEFGLKELALHYSVNGGPEQTVDLLKAKGQRQAEGSSVLSLENFKLVPGDVVSIYATAKNALLDSRTDMFFIQSDPFEREFSQSQQDGGGGGGGGSQADQTNISEREKQIIATTWKQQGDKNATRQHAADTGKFLSEIQSKLADQARSLAYRVQSRELTQESEEFNDFNSDMNKAAEAMGPAIQKLRDQKWKDAIPGEQKALQHLLRAEATFRQIEVAFSSGSGGNRGGGG